MVRTKTGLTASIGLAPNKMTAKIASDINKPDGLTIVHKDHLLRFLHPLPVNKLWGIGEKTYAQLRKRGIITIGDLAAYNRTELERVFGKNGTHIWELANGIDPRQVVFHDMMKSISNEITFEHDVSEPRLIKDALMQLSEKVSWRLRKNNLKSKTITLKIRFNTFKTYTRSATLPEATNFVEDIYKTVSQKAETFNLDEIDRKNKTQIRLLGVRASNLIDPAGQEDLFSRDNPSKKEQLHKAIDRIHDKFGEDAIRHRG